jgi:hypothetical protein
VVLADRVPCLLMTTDIYCIFSVICSFYNKTATMSFSMCWDGTAYACLRLSKQFYGILYNHATCAILLTFNSYFTIHTIVFMSYVFIVNIFGIPNMCTVT